MEGTYDTKEKKKERLAQIPEVNAFGMPYLNFLWVKVRNNKYMYVCLTI